MEIPGTAGPWLVLGLALGLLLAALCALAVPALRRSPDTDPASPAAPPAADPAVDDLPGFLESPPGSVPAAPVRDAGWFPLSPPPVPPSPAPAVPSHREGGGTTGVLAAMAVAGALLIGAAAAVATTRTPDAADRSPDAGPPAGSTAGPARGTMSADLSFASVVVQRHAVGVTVALPRVRVTSADGRTTAEVELATFNCLRDTAPPDPASARCSRSVTEYAELTTPELRVRTDGDTLHLAGAFPTERRPSGSSPVATGRVYELAVTAAPRDGRAGDGREAATGWLEIGGERVPMRDGGSSALSYGG